MEGNGSVLGRIITWTIIGIVALVALKLALRLIGVAFGLAAFLLFTVGPILLVGWLLVKAWRAFAKPAT